MNTDWMRGCATALVTPFKNSGEIDVDKIRSFVNWQIESGVRLLVPCGTTGESATMTGAEDELVIRTVVETAKGRAKVIAGIGNNHTDVVIENAVSRQKLGIDAALCVVPYYNKPTQAGLYAHFSAVAKAAPDLPIMLYNVPSRTACNMAAATTVKLARDVENIVAVKEASGNLSQIMEVLRDRPEGFKVFSGDDSFTFAMMALGADGLVSVASNEVPAEMSQMLDLCLEGNFDEARKIHFRLLNLMEINFIETSPAPVKAALAMMGMMEENLRLPLVPIMEASRDKIRQAISELGLLKTQEQSNSMM
jgi:4-hydroxy-tetrahydrodipicolinate synthase